MITVARVAMATSDPKNNRIQLYLRDYSTHEMGKDGVAYDDSAPVKTVALEAKPPDEKTLAAKAMNTRRADALPRPGLDRGRASSCTAASRSRWPASCWRWWAFRWASPRAKAANRRRM